MLHSTFQTRKHLDNLNKGSGAYAPYSHVFKAKACILDQC